jgi:hypothetical protein
MIENKEVVPAENPNSADSAPKPAEVGLGLIRVNIKNQSSPRFSPVFPPTVDVYCGRFMRRRRDWKRGSERKEA